MSVAALPLSCLPNFVENMRRESVLVLRQEDAVSSPHTPRRIAHRAREIGIRLLTIYFPAEPEEPTRTG